MLAYARLKKRMKPALDCRFFTSPIASSFFKLALCYTLPEGWDRHVPLVGTPTVALAMITRDSRPAASNRVESNERPASFAKHFATEGSTHIPYPRAPSECSP